jgi:hypothetical protein
MLQYSGVAYTSKKITGELSNLFDHPDYEYGLPVVVLNKKRMGKYKAALKNIGMRLNYYDTSSGASNMHAMEQILEEF